MSLNKTRVYNFERKHYYADGPRDNYQIDLFDMTVYDTFLLVVVDVFSRKIDIVKLKTKKAASVLEGLQTIFERMGYPNKIQTDKEAAVYSKQIKEFFSEKNIEVYSVENSYHAHSAGIVERLNRTIKNYILDNQNKKGRHRQLSEMANDVVAKFPALYNNTVHSTTKLKPNEAFTTKIDEAHGEQFARVNKPVDEPSNTFVIGDVVLLAKPKELITTKFSDKWEKEKYTIDEIKETNPTTYKLKNSKGVLMNGSYYPQQLQLIKRGEKDIKTKKSKYDVDEDLDLSEESDLTDDEDEYQRKCKTLLGPFMRF